MDAFKPILGKLATGMSLNCVEAGNAFGYLLSGEVTEAQCGAFLMALRLRGETLDELTGAVLAMRLKMLPVAAPSGTIDIVGTGGDGIGTYNVSTLSAILVAACGVPVAKHGNRKATSQSGASDVLTELGVSIGLLPEDLSVCLADAGLCFMSAPTHHPAMRHVAKARAELGIRSIFNLLGPLCNPAGVKYQLLGVYDKKWCWPLADVLKTLGSERVWVVNGSDGMDELTVTGPSYVTELCDGKIRSFALSPEDAGLKLWPLEALKGGDASTNARALKDVLGGAEDAYRDITLLNAGAALFIAGAANNLRDGVEKASASIRSGKAQATLDKLIKVSTRLEMASRPLALSQG